MPTIFKRLIDRIKHIFRNKESKTKRTYRSFRLSKRSDYVRELKLPSYIKLTWTPIKLILEHKKLFVSFIVLYSIVSVIVIGLASQTTYNQVVETVGTFGDGLNMKLLGRSMAVAIAGIAGGFSAGNINSNGAVAALLLLIGWLTIIWLGRAVMRHEHPKLRDGLYNAGAPIVPTAILAVIALVQLIPAAAGLLAVRAGVASGYFVTGIEGMLLVVPMVLLAALSFYWLTTTMLSLVIVTLPGMYPLAAHRHAYDLIRGRRLTIILRWVWVLLVQFIFWLIVLVPVVIIERLIHDHVGFLQNVPFVPIIVLLLTSFSLVYTALYSYQLYRSIVDYDTK